jgi:hypothetical protein
MNGQKGRKGRNEIKGRWNKKFKKKYKEKE